MQQQMTNTPKSGEASETGCGLTGASDGSSGPPSSGVPAAAGSRNRDRQLLSSAVLLWPGHTGPNAETAGRAQQDLPGGGSHQGGCLGHR